MRHTEPKFLFKLLISVFNKKVIGLFSCRVPAKNSVAGMNLGCNRNLSALFKSP
jgi:hypothetical protein